MRAIMEGPMRMSSTVAPGKNKKKSVGTFIDGCLFIAIFFSWDKPHPLG
jgi:hypothetical protein